MKKEIKISKEEMKKCQVVIHSASVAAAAAALAPIPVADAVPITAAQVGMIIGLGKVFDIDINDSVSKAILGCGVAQNVGRTIAASLLKMIPGANIVVAPIVNPTVASAITEGMGWLIADDFYKMSINEKPVNIISKIPNFESLFNNSKIKTKNRTPVTRKSKNSKNK